MNVIRKTPEGRGSRKLTRNSLTASRPHHKTKSRQIKKVLIATDFSDNALHALKMSLPLIRAVQAELILIHVAGTFYDSAEHIQAFNAVTKQMEALVKKNIPAEITSKILVRNGVPFHEILRAAREEQSDLIVIGTHGYTGLKYIMLGSTAEKVVRHAICPVLVIPDSSKARRRNRAPTQGFAR